jgi:hypothetical protein
MTEYLTQIGTLGEGFEIDEDGVITVGSGKVTSVIDYTNTPPTTPVSGDIYAVGSSPTGAWADHAYKIATYTTTWAFTDPKLNELVFVESSSIMYIWNGTTFVQTSSPGFTPQVTHTIYVDNARTDDYTPDGTIEKPFLSVQDAHDSITGTPSITNTYGIAVALGHQYTGTLNISKDYISIFGHGMSKGAGFKGTLNITSKHLTLQGIHLTGTSSATRDCYINLSQTGDFLLEIKDCRLSYCTMAIEATGTSGQLSNSYVQVTGANGLWLQNTITCTGIKGTLALVGGLYAVNTLNAYNCYLVMGAAVADTNTINLESGTLAELGGGFPERNTTNLKTGATLYADGLFAGNSLLTGYKNVLSNTGGTLHLLTSGSGISNDSSVSGATVKDALETLASSSGGMDIHGLTEESGIVSIDQLAFYDESATANRKIPFSDFNSALNLSYSPWTEVTAFTATPTSTSTITTTSDLSGTIKAGFPLKYTIGGTTYYGIVVAITSNLITVGGISLSGDITALYYGNPDRMVQIDFLIPGYYEDATNHALLGADLGQCLTWKQGPAYIVAYSPRSRIVDGSSNGTTNLVKAQGHAGTAQAGAATTITLSTRASAVDDAYNNLYVAIIAGTGSGQIRQITDYVGSTKVATVATWTTNPDSTSEYKILLGDPSSSSGILSSAITLAYPKEWYSSGILINSAMYLLNYGDEIEVYAGKGTGGDALDLSGVIVVVMA